MSELSSRSVAILEALMMWFCCMVPMAISCTFMGLYWSLWVDAQEFNEEFRTDEVSNPFDTCGLINDDLGATMDGDTEWTTAFLLNAIVYTSSSFFTLMLALSPIFKPLGIIGTLGHLIGCLAEISAIVVAGVYRFGSDGEKCADNTVEIVGYDWTGASIGQKYRDIFISQCALFLID